jgi:hypothetical protein
MLRRETASVLLRRRPWSPFGRKSRAGLEWTQVKQKIGGGNGIVNGAAFGGGPANLPPSASHQRNAARITMRTPATVLVMEKR